VTRPVLRLILWPAIVTLAVTLLLGLTGEPLPWSSEPLSREAGGAAALGEAALAYALSARLPVLLIMFASIFGGLDTHHVEPRLDFPEVGPGGLFFWTALLPPFSVSIYLTVVGGLIFGCLAAFFACED
jgi:hypothetical protein